jgi:hypothetical protein
MQMKMGYALPAILFGVNNETITALRQTLFARQLSRRNEQMPGKSFIAFSELIHALYMLFGNQQYMCRRNGIQIAKGIKAFVLKHFCARYFTVKDFTKYAGQEQSPPL